MARPMNDLNVAVVGYAFMGRAHSQAWATAPRHFDLPLRPRLKVLCGRNRDACEQAAAQLGWEEAETDWRRVVDRDDVDLVDVCTPGSTHTEIALAALEAGKHVLCEKPLANTVEEAKAMADAADKAAAAGVRAMVGFNYRRVPACAYARDLVAAGRLGEIRHVRAVYLQDWIVDPDFPLLWRLRSDEAGSGALGDIGAHIIDLTQFVLGDRIERVSGLTETFVRERPLPDDPSRRGPVTVDDAALFLARFAGGAVATFEATRFATGRRNALRIEVNGSDGSLAFDLERLNELEFHDAANPGAERGFRRILMTEEDHPYLSAWWPPGHILGWEHTFTHEVSDLVAGIAAGRDVPPTFADGLQVQQVLDAVTRSARDGGWQPVR